ncbi:hypothetical protein JCM11957_14020 [Caminibacter profundus]
MKQEKWVMQLLEPSHYTHLFNMLHANIEDVDIKVVVVGGALLPAFAPGHLKEKIEEFAAKGVNFNFCINSMHLLGLDSKDLPKGTSIANEGGLQAINAYRKAGYTYFVVA